MYIFDHYDAVLHLSCIFILHTAALSHLDMLLDMLCYVMSQTVFDEYRDIERQQIIMSYFHFLCMYIAVQKL